MWIARDRDGSLNIFKDEPIKYPQLGQWGDIDADVKYVEVGVDYDEIFFDVKWSDEEPHELVLKPIKEE